MLSEEPVGVPGEPGQHQLRAVPGGQLSEGRLDQDGPLGVLAAHPTLGQMAVGQRGLVGVSLPVEVNLHQAPELAVFSECHRSRNPPNGGQHSMEWRTGQEGFRGVAQLARDRAAREAFDRYVTPELEVLARVALSITRNHHDAEDLVQETLLCAYRAIERFDGAHPRAWLLTIMRNAEAKRHRRRRPFLLRDGDEALHRAGEDRARATSSPEEVIVGDEFDAVVAECLLVLPERHRQVVELVDIDGLSYSEAAQVIGVPVGTVMSRLHRARARIRQRLVASGLAPKRSIR